MTNNLAWTLVVVAFVIAAIVAYHLEGTWQRKAILLFAGVAALVTFWLTS